MIKTAVVNVTPKNGPNYLGWRGELLTKAVLAGVPGVTVFGDATAGLRDADFDFVVAEGLQTFFVIVKAYSSFRTEPNDVIEHPTIRWTLPARLVRKAVQSPNPVLLFVFDADTGHGRYLRLDTLPLPAPSQKSVNLDLPIEQTISVEALTDLIRHFRPANGRKGK